MEELIKLIFKIIAFSIILFFVWNEKGSFPFIYSTVGVIYLVVVTDFEEIFKEK